MTGFTGKERDTESGLDYFGARYFSAAQGRFTSPDAPFADQHATNPQSWNLYTYTRNNPLSFVDPDGSEVRALTPLALERIRNTVPKEIRSQIVADKNGALDRSAIGAIKNGDSNFLMLKQAVGLDKTIEVTTGSSVVGGAPAGIVGLAFTYEKADSPGGIPTVYDGFTQTATESPSGNVRVTVADGAGATAQEPKQELVVVTAHELYGHALPMAQGKPAKGYQHDDGGPVDKKIKAIQDHTKELNQQR